MISKRNNDPLPAEELGQRLCNTFGRYRWKFIYADVPASNEPKAKWKTENRYPIKNRVLFRQWQDLEELIGVRFDHETLYALIDIDRKSRYHPRNSSDGISTIQAALETIGITRTIVISSSWSDGLHLYVPLAELVNTFNLALAIKGCLEVQGLELGLGQLEVFPNPKPYGNTIKTEYLAHRLPLQPGTGSHLLDEDLNFISAELGDFFTAWDSAAASQDVEALSIALSVARDNNRKRPRRRLNKAAAWEKDLLTVISTGWTSGGQTNGLLKQIATYGVVFGDKSGEELVSYISETAINSPGYEQWCGHQAEIEQRARCWANSVEKFYWPLGTHPQRDVANNIVPFKHNQRLSESAGEKIKAAVEELESTNALPEKATARAKAINAISGSSFQTLYAAHHKELWHPEHYAPSEGGVITEPAVETAVRAAQLELPRKAPNPLCSKELQTKPPVMKCWPPEIPLKESKTSSRGVRGEEESFPQAERPILRPVPRPMSPQEPYEPGIDVEEDEVIRGIQKQVRRLAWTIEEIGQFVAERFGGKRRYQLSHDELVLLLYYLQTQV